MVGTKHQPDNYYRSRSRRARRACCSS